MHLSASSLQSKNSKVYLVARSTRSASITCSNIILLPISATYSKSHKDSSSNSLSSQYHNLGCLLHQSFWSLNLKRATILFSLLFHLLFLQYLANVAFPNSTPQTLGIRASMEAQEMSIWYCRERMLRAYSLFLPCALTTNEVFVQKDEPEVRSWFLLLACVHHVIISHRICSEFNILSSSSCTIVHIHSPFLRLEFVVSDMMRQEGLSASDNLSVCKDIGCTKFFLIRVSSQALIPLVGSMYSNMLNL
ncbi:hypothetical protein Tco_1402725 [Tanacetum coccineum]